MTTIPDELRAARARAVVAHRRTAFAARTARYVRERASYVEGPPADVWLDAAGPGTVITRKQVTDAMRDAALCTLLDCIPALSEHGVEVTFRDRAGVRTVVLCSDHRCYPLTDVEARSSSFLPRGGPEDTR